MADPPLTPITIRTFDGHEPINRFSCGRIGIDRWFKNKAKKCAERFEHRVYVALADGDQCPIGFYALQLGSESLDAFEQNAPQDYVRNLPAFPAVHLAYLGVRNDFQGRGIGRFLLGDIFNKAYQINEIAGCYALTLQSLDADSTAFYKRLGFVPYSTDPDHPKMLLPIRTVRALVEGERAAKAAP